MPLSMVGAMPNPTVGAILNAADGILNTGGALGAGFEVPTTGA
jgi:hypothetical protein